MVELHKMKELFKRLCSRYPKYKKILGILLILLGLAALLSPFTPGSWLVFVGLELLGVRLLAWDRLKRRFGI